MTEHLITRVSFTPKASNASDFNNVTVAGLSDHLKGIILDKCGSQAGSCPRRECKEENIMFNQSINKLVQSSSVLPENFVAHIRSQAEK